MVYACMHVCIKDRTWIDVSYLLDALLLVVLLARRLHDNLWLCLSVLHLLLHKGAHKSTMSVLVIHVHNFFGTTYHVHT
jgi:hypothetical protein